MSMNNERLGTVQAVERALDVLLCLAAGGDLGPTEIGAHLDLHKSTVHRLLRTLASRDFVLQDKRTQLYSVGPATLRVAQRLIISPDLARAAQSVLEGLRETTSETAVLDVRIGDERICIAQAESEHEIRRLQRLASSMEIYAGACGRVLLMDESLAELKNLARRLAFTRLTQRTPTTVDQLRRHIELLGRNGYTISVAERVVGATTVAVPVRNAGGVLVAALAVTGPSFRFDTRKAQAAVAPLKDAADRLSTYLGPLATAWPLHNRA